MPNRLLQRALARKVALRLVRLKRHRPIEFAIHSTGDYVRLPINDDTVLAGNPGIYSLRFYERRSGRFFGYPVTPDFHKLGHATLDAIKSEPPHRPGSIMRQVSAVQEGHLNRAIGGWISGWLGTRPQDFGDDIREVNIESSDGWTLPCWLQMVADEPSTSWMIHVHGRGANPAETARNFSQLQKLGFNNLSISYRNDATAKRNGRIERGTLGLGTTEWPDLEAAVAYAKANGAQRILVFGWSYGAAISTQFAAKSELAKHVSGYIFDSPVISWRATLEYQVALTGAPMHWLALGENFLSNAKSAKSIGLAEPIDFEEFEVTALANDFEKPALLLHSADDGYIPIEPCRDLTALLPDTIALVEFQGARHCKLYNHDLAKYSGAIGAFIERVGAKQN